jgi:two-component system, OmpR family, KDP operon response regulator KdpE
VLLKRLREWSQVPIIILTARGKEREKVEGLDTGADDYLAKPFDVEELMARIRVALRHTQRIKQPGDESVFQTADFKVDMSARVVTVREKEDAFDSRMNTTFWRF